MTNLLALLLETRGRSRWSRSPTGCRAVPGGRGRACGARSSATRRCCATSACRWRPRCSRGDEAGRTAVPHRPRPLRAGRAAADRRRAARAAAGGRRGPLGRRPVRAAQARRRPSLGAASVVANVPDARGAAGAARSQPPRGPTVRFDYRGVAATLEPYALLLRERLLVRHRLRPSTATSVRTYRVDRIEGDVTVGRPGGVRAPGRVRPATGVPDRPEGARRRAGGARGCWSTTRRAGRGRTRAGRATRRAHGSPTARS